MAFEGKVSDGLYQKVSGGVWHVRRGIPADVRAHFGGRYNWTVSTKTRDLGRARHVRDDLWRRWDGEIAEARRAGPGRVLAVDEAIEAIERWRSSRILAAAGYVAPEQAVDIKFLMAGFTVSSEQVAAALGSKPDPAPVKKGPLTWARAYFESGKRLRGTEPPYAVTFLLGRLQRAAREPDGWAAVDSFDEHLAAVVSPAVLPSTVRSAVRQRFAEAWLEVVQHEEAERLRADAILAAVEADALQASAIRLPPAATALYEPREGDKTVGEVLDAFREAQADPALWQKEFGHVARTVGEIIGRDKPIRAVTVLDVRDVKRFLATLPTNVTKRKVFKGKPLAYAAERAEIEGLPTLAPNTVRSYMINLKGICTFAADPARGWLDRNPVDGEVPGKRNVVRRHGLTPDQLSLVFGRLDADRAAGSAHFWVPAILAWMGARANEIAQLHVNDVKEEDGIPFIDLDVFDEEGRRLERRRVKTEESARCIPVHQEIIGAGFLDLVNLRRQAGEPRLFPDLKPNARGYYTHEVSRRWGRLLDDVGLTAPALTLHSLRHGWKTAAGRARLPTYLVAALGGWGSAGVGEGKGSALFGYGPATRAAVPDNAAAMNDVKLGEFTLSR